MTQYELARVAVRLIAVVIFAFTAWIAASTIGGLIGLVGVFFRGGTGVGMSEAGMVLAASVVPIGVLLAIGVVVWFKSGYIAGRVVGSTADPRPITQVDARVLLGIGCSLIGVWLVIFSTTALAMLLAMELAGPSAEPLAAARGGVGPMAFGELLKLGAGLYLLLGARGLIDLIHRARTAGHVQPTDDLSPPSV